jgi:hypothetical protein
MNKEEKILESQKQTQEDLKNSELILKCRRLFNQAKESRRKIDWEWLVRTLYVRGYHFAKYNRGTSTVVFSTRTGVRIPINLTGAHLRGVRNQVTSFQPKWEVIPNVTTSSAIDNARYSGKVLDYIYDKTQIKRKIKEVVTDSLIYSIGIWQFDKDNNGNIVIHRVDPFDLWIDPNTKSPNLSDPYYGAEYVDKTIQTSLTAIKKNSKFKNTEYLHADNIIASAEYKRFLLQVTRAYIESKQQDNETIILHETWMRDRKENSEIKMKVVHWVEQLPIPLLVQNLDESDYPFEILQGDINPGEIYGESWVKHLIPVNRVIDALESHIFEYNHFFAKGRFVVDKNSGVRMIVNQHGQIIEKNRGAQVQAITVPPLPPSPQEQLRNMRSYMEDISGVHDISLGRMPSSVRSGTAIAELKQADATNQSDLVDNLEDFLSRAGKKILKIVSENWTTSKLISVTGLGGKPEYFMAAGEKSSLKDKNKYTFGEMELPLAIIGKDNEVRVQVGSWLAYTKEARMEKLKELFRLGAIDQKTYLEYAEFADIDGIYERTREERILQMRAGRPNQMVKNRLGMELDDEQLALSENELMMEGKEMPVEPEDDHEVHISVHKEHQENDLVRAHLNEHIQQMRLLLTTGNIQSGAAPGQPGEVQQSPGGEVVPGGGAVGNIPPEILAGLGGQ